jgi:4a-hydroxytetrahydrobiopterin dehydratase
MLELKERDCVHIEEGTNALQTKDVEIYRKQLVTKWLIIENKKLKREFPFEQYKRAMAFAQEVALIAEKENHHPVICIHFNKVIIELSTHDISGLSENDFIMAAKIEDL